MASLVGAVVLPGLDREMDEASWSVLTAPAPKPAVLGHPQYGLAKLLGKIGVIGRAVAGGAIALGAGTAGNPSLARLTDENTGLFFPAADVLALATAGLERLRITADGRLGLGTTTPTGVLDVADNKLRVRTAQTPASATAAGNQGEIAWDANHVYVCTATNTWRRAALSTW